MLAPFFFGPNNRKETKEMTTTTAVSSGLLIGHRVRVTLGDQMGVWTSSSWVRVTHVDEDDPDFVYGIVESKRGKAVDVGDGVGFHADRIEAIAGASQPATRQRRGRR